MNLGAGKDEWYAFGSLGANGVEPAKFDSEHTLIQE
jgi:hypothetical protein